MAIAHDPETFSNAVSRHLHVPNGLDGAVHAAMRRLIDPFFAAEEIDALVPSFEMIARALIEPLAASGETFDAVELGARYAVRAQCAWLGWRADLEDELLTWVDERRAAVRSGDSARTERAAESFDRIIRGLLAERRSEPRADVTMRLMHTRTVEGRPLADEEIVSILRNWTGGDLASLALCTGVVLHWLARHPRRAARLRTAGDEQLDAAVDEILRADDPFLSSRRIVTRAATVDGCPAAAGDVVVLDWRAANRDPAVFGDPDAFDPLGNAAANLVYGTGVHMCPGRGLATLELRVLVRAVLAAGAPELDHTRPATREQPPAGGWRTVPLRIRRP